MPFWYTLWGTTDHFPHQSPAFTGEKDAPAKFPRSCSSTGEGCRRRRYALCSVKMWLLWAAGQCADTESWQQTCQRDHEVGMGGFQLVQEIIFRASLRAKHNTKLASERESTSAGAVGSGSGAERALGEKPGPGFYLGQHWGSAGNSYFLAVCHCCVSKPVSICSGLPEVPLGRVTFLSFLVAFTQR